MTAAQLFDTYFKSAFTVDNSIFGFDEGTLKILLIRRNEEPHNEAWALPGYFVEQGEALDAAAQRVLREMTGMTNVYLEQLQTFGDPKRHALGRVITVAYYSLVKIADFQPRAAGVAQDVTWHAVNQLPELAFDHRAIIGRGPREIKAQYPYPAGRFRTAAARVYADRTSAPVRGDLGNGTGKAKL